MNIPRRYSSKQRSAILAAVLAIPGHPTAEEVHRAVRRRFPRISLATVYRNLNLLVTDGTIGAVDHVREGKMVFDKMIAPHHHFICITCGSITDIPALPIAPLASKVTAHIHGTVLESRIEFSGVCQACKKKNKK